MTAPEGGGYCLAVKQAEKTDWRLDVMKQELIGGLVLCLIGLGLVFAPPVTLWTLTEKWKTEGGKGPSKQYAVLIRILGAVFAAAGCALAVSGF